MPHCNSRMEFCSMLAQLCVGRNEWKQNCHAAPPSAECPAQGWNVIINYKKHSHPDMMLLLIRRNTNIQTDRLQLYFSLLRSSWLLQEELIKAHKASPNICSLHLFFLKVCFFYSEQGLTSAISPTGHARIAQELRPCSYCLSQRCEHPPGPSL